MVIPFMPCEPTTAILLQRKEDASSTSGGSAQTSKHIYSFNLWAHIAHIFL